MKLFFIRKCSSLNHYCSNNKFQSSCNTFDRKYWEVKRERSLYIQQIISLTRNKCNNCLLYIEKVISVINFALKIIKLKINIERYIVITAVMTWLINNKRAIIARIEKRWLIQSKISVAVARMIIYISSTISENYCCDMCARFKLNIKYD